MITYERTSVLVDKKYLSGKNLDSSGDIGLVAAVKEALEGIDRGEFVTLEEIKKEFSSWFIE